MNADSYADIPSAWTFIPRVPVDLGETLGGAISKDYFTYFLGQLPCQKAPGPYRVQYELL